MSDQVRTEERPRDADGGSTRVGGGERAGSEAQRLLGVVWETGARLVRQGNQRRLTLRSRDGEAWVRMPLTLAALLALLLLPYWPLLVVLIVIGFAVGAQLSVERNAAMTLGNGPGAPDGAA
jgi:hypothetical protein